MILSLYLAVEPVLATDDGYFGTSRALGDERWAGPRLAQARTETTLSSQASTPGAFAPNYATKRARAIYLLV
jgi:hypothetical protein